MAPPMPLWSMVLLALAASTFLTFWTRRVAAETGLLDVPNARSSHGTPVPRGGGVAIVLVTTVALGVLGARDLLRPGLFWGLGGGGLAVALTGLADDRKSLSPGTRLAVHFTAALWSLLWLGGLPPLQFGDRVISSGWLGYLLGAFGIVWAINLFNFMDGIDSLAASEAIFVAVAGALLGSPMAVGGGVRPAAWLFAAACGGFLVWNWPPARIFLGDVGSGYLGYVIVVLAVAATRNNPVALWVWLILGGAFFVDATVTLLRRTLRSERVYEAHRDHAYQWMARRWRSHAKVTGAVFAVNLLWLLPWGMFAASHPNYAVEAVLVAFIPLAVLAVNCGAGRKE
jgi:Fuc2NAc and GlcNAc transferase